MKTMKRLTDETGEVLQSVLKKNLYCNGSVKAMNTTGNVDTLSTSYIKQELIPFLRYGMAKLRDYKSFYINDKIIFGVDDNGIMVVHTENCEDLLKEVC